MRVFADKFTTTEDRTWFEEELNSILLVTTPEKSGKEKKGRSKDDKVWTSDGGEE